MENSVSIQEQGIANALTQRPDFEEVAEAYAQALEGSLYAPEHTKAKFARLKAFLRHYSMN